MQSDALTPEFVADGQEAVDGRYPLGALLGRSAGGVVYQTTFGEGEEARQAAIKVSRGDLPESAGILDRWKAAMSFSHPNLLRIYAAGRSVMSDGPIIFVVMERAEESLAGVLAQRRLSQEEAREMLAPTLGAVEYLHTRGYAHGRIKPSNVLASGDTVKLSSDSVSVADDDARAEDVYAIGRLIQQSLAPGSGLAGSPVLGDIVDHALDGDVRRRWTVRQIQSRLQGPRETSLAAAVHEPRTMAIEEDVEEQEPPRRRFPVWIFAGLAALILLVVGLATMRRKEPAPAPVRTPAPIREPAIATTPKPSPLVPPPARVTPPVSEVHGRRAGGWAVIVAAYGTQAPAEKRERSLESKWPGFQWSVLQQKAEKSYYLVVIGRNLSEEDAEALRKKAVQTGLPRDVYIKRM